MTCDLFRVMNLFKKNLFMFLFLCINEKRVVIVDIDVINRVLESKSVVVFVQLP